ncbi:MAG: DEAD/DEAH box helicase [Pseudonocardiaceae bacterium]
MFNRGVDELLEALPSLSGLPTEQIRRLLTRAWLEATDLQSGASEPEADTQLPSDLRRLATALEIHAVLPLDIGSATVRACAFVAAEALMIAHELAPLEAREQQFWMFGSTRRFEQVESGLLYLIAGYDANAALTVGGFGETNHIADPEGQIAEWVLIKIRALLRLVPIADDEHPQPPPAPGTDAPLRSIVRHEIWRQIGSHISDHVRWLTFEAPTNPQAGVALQALADQLERRPDELSAPAQHADLHHLALLLAAACDGTTGRALRGVPPPDGDGGRFEMYQRERARTRPLLWPAAEVYARKTLPGPQSHAVVSVPTGSGKSSVAELAIAQALRDGWVLYLAPTNALVGQIRRHTADIFGSSSVREFIGGAEYTELVGESLTEIEDCKVLVMTPEKCSLALRQSPDAFARLSLCVLDEAHILGERNGRGVIAELVIAEVLHRAPQARLLLLSALVANPHDLASWLGDATQIPAIVVDEPWRPTRTLRAIAGFDNDRTKAVGGAALTTLSQRGPSRVKEKFTAPIALLVGLQGAWRSTEALDYNLVKTDIGVELAVSRNGQLKPEGYCNRASAALVQRLGERGDRVLAFLPSNKHYSFLAATTMPGFNSSSVEPDKTVESLLALAELELGVETALRGTLLKRIAVHTSALLREEQRASEVAFDKESALAMFATGTMAQGLNLPATAVVIGGTDIGYDDQASVEQKKQRTRAQLLNAIGRAGRAHVAPRSMAIVVPNKPVFLDSADNAMQAVRAAEFLQEEDASTNIASALDDLIETAISGDLHVETMGDTDQTAFAFLSFASEHDDTQGVISKTWAIHRAQVVPRAREIASAVDALGQSFVAQAGAPPWIALAAHRSGISLPETVQLYHGLRVRLTDRAAPTTIVEWARLMIELLRTLPLRALERMLPKKAYGTSRLSGIHAVDQAERGTGWSAFERALAAWMTGKPLITVAEEIHPRPVNGNAGRGSQDPLPRVITVVAEGFRFELSLIAGALGAIVATGREEDPDGPWGLPEESLRCLTLLPLAVRSGAASPEVLAWMRAGVQPRAAAHMLSDLLPAPEGETDDQLQRWAYGRFMVLLEGAIVGVTTPEHDRILQALAVVRDAR